MSSTLNNELESVLYYNERNLQQWKKKCEHLFGKRGNGKTLNKRVYFIIR